MWEFTQKGVKYLIMEIKHIKGNTFIIETDLSLIPFYKIDDEEIILLDSGWSGERNGIDTLLKENNLKVSGIISTHAHTDHVGNNKYFKDEYGAITAMPAYEAVLCSSALNLKVYYSNLNLTVVNEHYGSMICETDILIQPEITKVLICGIMFRILHTPGHSPSHICIITPDNTAYLGDALIDYNIMESAKMPYAFILKEDLKSKLKLKNLKCSKYILSHKGVYDDISKLITDNINFYKSRAAGVYSLITTDMTMEQIMSAAVKKFDIDIKNTYRHLVIERMLKSYVEYLEETGAIALNIKDGFAKYTRGI